MKQKLRRTLNKYNWNKQDSWKYRVYSLVTDRYPWWDWGHKLMILVGHNWCGNWQEPEPSTIWYKIKYKKRMARTNYPVPSVEVIKDYKAFSRLYQILNEDEQYEWKAICVNQDGDLKLGKQYWGGPFYGLSQVEMNLLRKYLNRWWLTNWFGIRSWLYSQALHAAVYRKKPFTCGADGGAYSHWRCELKKNHKGNHKLNNATWKSKAEK